MCDGVPKNGQQYPNQNPQGKHEPYENYGSDCVICGLPRAAMEGGSNLKLPIRAIASAITAVVALGVVGGGYFLFKSKFQSCPVGQQKVADVCVAINPTSTTPNNPAPPGTTAPTNSSGTFRTFAEVPNVPSLQVKYGGSTSFAPLRSLQIVGRITQAHPGYSLVYTEPTAGTKPGSGSGIRMLIDGMLTFAQSSRPLKQDEKSAAQAKNIILEEKAIAFDAIAIYINPQLSIPGLTTSQIKDIFTGKITNWNQVGGPNVPVTPISRDPQDGGTPEFFIEKALANEPFAPSVQPYMRDVTSSIQKVGKTPGGISYATASEVCNQNRIVSTVGISSVAGQPFIAPCTGVSVNQAELSKGAYPLTRQLYIVIKKDSGQDEQAGTAYANMLLSDEGQQIINSVGLIAIR
ncbi:MAG: PstS family phosphate ABC transporter substrate-binding protein [Calothrix sp. SM1_7_51]|nr:PstS family phosphate ABC transporter substrate-binding protein [Calothrix sp. SM1_7_51]